MCCFGCLDLCTVDPCAVPALSCRHLVPLGLLLCHVCAACDPQSCTSPLRYFACAADISSEGLTCCCLLTITSQVDWANDKDFGFFEKKWTEGGLSSKRGRSRSRSRSPSR
jgi:hypothetical protein